MGRGSLRGTSDLGSGMALAWQKSKCEIRESEVEGRESAMALAHSARIHTDRTDGDALRVHRVRAI